MKNETYIYIGAAALIYYLYKKSKKTALPVNLMVIETPILQSLTDAALKALILDLQRNPSKYKNPEIYLNYATVEFNKRTGIYQTI